MNENKTNCSEIPSIEMTAGYQDRATQSLGTRQCGDWVIKVYQITPRNFDLPDSVVTAAIDFIREKIEWPYDLDKKFGIAALHTGSKLLWLQAKLWTDDLLRQYVFCAPLGTPTEFGDSPLPGFNECVWELEVTKHERDAWVRHVMTPKQPDVDSYLNDVLTID